MRAELKKQKEYLKGDYQPQWYFKTIASAKKELLWQKKMNPDTYKWLLTKDIKVGGKRVSTTEVMAKLKSQIKSSGRFKILSDRELTKGVID